jgi:hypothetical protein
MSLVLVCCSLTASGQKDTTYRGRKYKTPLATARIEITVLRDVNGKPIENAAVIFHPIAGEVSKGNMELKTNEDGKTVIDVLPMGDTVRLQIIAKGFQTYGEDFKVDKSEFSKEIRLKRPGEQYSIYKDHPEANGGDKGTDSGKPANAPAEAGKADGKAGAFQDSSADSASKDKPAAKPDTQPSQSQPPK